MSLFMRFLSIVLDGVKGLRLTKDKPAIPPTGTQSDIALGSFTVGSPHSSAMDDIMPIAENLFDIAVSVWP